MATPEPPARLDDFQIRAIGNLRKRHDARITEQADRIQQHTGRAATDVIGDDGKVRVLSRRCETCIFRNGAPMHLSTARFNEIVRRNVDAGALLTCHSTLPYGEHPDFGPAVCAGFWAQHAMSTAAGRMARFMLGVTRIDPPGQ